VELPLLLLVAVCVPADDVEGEPPDEDAAEVDDEAAPEAVPVVLVPVVLVLVPELADGVPPPPRFAVGFIKHAPSYDGLTT